MPSVSKAQLFLSLCEELSGKTKAALGLGAAVGGGYLLHRLHHGDYPPVIPAGSADGGDPGAVVAPWQDDHPVTGAVKGIVKNPHVQRAALAAGLLAASAGANYVAKHGVSRVVKDAGSAIASGARHAKTAVAHHAPGTAQRKYDQYMAHLHEPMRQVAKHSLPDFGTTGP